MKIFIICSKAFYGEIPKIKGILEKAGHTVTLPNSYEDPFSEDKFRDRGEKIHAKWKKEMFLKSMDIIEQSDAVLVLNFEKNGIKNYIGGATFLEMYDAFRMGKKIFIYNQIPEGMLKDEIIGFNPKVLNSDLKILTSI